MPAGLENRVNISTATYFPFSLLLPSGALEHMARRHGADGLEFLPTRALVAELTASRLMGREGKLACNESIVASTHMPWARDREIERELELPLTSQQRLMNRLFRLVLPGTDSGIKAVNDISRAYGVRTVIHWPEDVFKVLQPTLEIVPEIGMIQASSKPWTPDQILKWVQSGDERRLAIDTSHRKAGKYLENIGVTNKDDVFKVVDRFLPYVAEAHFQAGNEQELKDILNGNYDSAQAQLLRRIKAYNPDIAITIELNFVDLLSKLRGDLFKFYPRSVEFVRRA